MGVNLKVGHSVLLSTVCKGVESAATVYNALECAATGVAQGASQLKRSVNRINALKDNILFKLSLKDPVEHEKNILYNLISNKEKSLCEIRSEILFVNMKNEDFALNSIILRIKENKGFAMLLEKAVEEFEKTGDQKSFLEEAAEIRKNFEIMNSASETANSFLRRIHKLKEEIDLYS